MSIRQVFCDLYGKVNVAINKRAYQSSYHDVYRASTAVDGITVQQGNNFMHTRIERPYTWWEVDLGQMSFIRDVVIYFRVKFTWRRNGVQVYTNTQERTSNNGHLCGTVTGRPDGSDIPDVVNITCDVNARYVTIYQDTDNGESTALDFLEVEVYSCEENVAYGTHCSKLCSDRKCADSPAPCHLQTGSCSGECRAGWSGTDCIDECQKGVAYGVGCALRCTDRHCLKTSSCDTKDGTCIGGCLPGWILSGCSEACRNGLYGPRCSRSCADRHCDGYSRCDHTDGKCETVCEVGWKGVDCAVCDGRYGVNCSLACGKRNCKDNSPCDFQSGECVGGCKPGWTTLTCTQQCAVGNYGADCQKLCQNRKCQGDQQCGPEAGQCSGGCQEGWSGTACTIRIDSSTGVVVGIVVGVVIVAIVIALVAVVLIRKRRILNCETKGTDTSKDSKVNCNSRNEYVNIAFPNLQVSNGTEELAETKPADECSTQVNLDSTLEEVDEQEDNLNDTSGTEYCNISHFSPPQGGFVVSDLPQVLEKIRNQPGGFETEYKKLPSGFNFPYTESQLPGNRGKNRFRGYYPYDQNRVVLTMLPEVPHSDYINASYLDSYSEKQHFIAAQAPNKNTLSDFWRMIWEKDCGNIIMLTNLVEDLKEKCQPYWSDTEMMTIGPFSIVVDEKQERVDVVYRKLSVSHKESGKSKTFQQLHFIAWPDHGVPNVHDFIEFMWRVRKTKPTLPGPVLVHCSAGIGRTGTYIALDILMDEMEATGRVDVLNVMTKMRDQRKGLVQTKEQYETIFVALIEVEKFGDTSLGYHDFENQYPKQKEALLMGKKTVEQLAQDIEALNDTAYEDDADKYKVWIDDEVAMCPPSRLLRDGYLIVPDSEGKEETLWKLVSESDSYTIVTLSNETGVDRIPQASQTMTHGKTTITAVRQTSVTHEITEVTLDVETEGEKRQIKRYSIKGWLHTTDSSTLISCLTTMVEKIQSQQEHAGMHPITVVYSESQAKNAITMCITNNIMTDIRLDTEVEIFRNVRRFQAVLPNVQLTKKDFELFCNIACWNPEESSVYANCPPTGN
ncbi:receptor-type tyrosine-protein phosphatase T-like [Gigantopelta aegis]|uniref:receptor-type tyrosine-protein phosphatase T-like n=1 Tax=Gigantopelta aegis TaxID=1735272 RepID=UPI001B88A9ED|nr:receptor-type tyrosine-protein phosphatase T-like [Gigantopelta aegis]